MKHSEVLGRYAANSCPICYGRGWYKANPAGAVYKIAKGEDNPSLAAICRCADKAYRREVKERIRKPCPECSTSGYCEHRPATLSAYLRALDKWETK